MEDLLGEAVINLGLLAGFLLILGIGGLIADYVFPHIPFIEKYLDSLPLWEDEEEKEHETEVLFLKECDKGQKEIS